MRESPLFSLWKRPKSHLGRIWDISRIPFIGKPTKSSSLLAKLPASSRQNTTYCYIHHRPIMSYSEMGGTCLADGEGILTMFQTRLLSHHLIHTKYICGRKIPSLQPNSSYQHCRLRRLHAAMKSDLKSSKLQQKSSLVYSCVSSGLVFWEGTESSTDWSDHPHKLNGRQE